MSQMDISQTMERQETGRVKNSRVRATRATSSQIWWSLMVISLIANQTFAGVRVRRQAEMSKILIYNP